MAVDLERKAAAGRIRRGDEFDGAKPDLLRQRIGRQIHGQRIERLLAAAGGPPEARLVDLEDVIHDCFAGTDANVEAHALAVERKMHRHDTGRCWQAAWH